MLGFQPVPLSMADTVRVPANLMGVEFSLSVLEPGNLGRVDVVVWRPGEGQLRPWLLVECKEPRVRIDQTQLAMILGRVRLGTARRRKRFRRISWLLSDAGAGKSAARLRALCETHRATGAKSRVIH